MEGTGEGVRIPLSSETTLFKYNVSTIEEIEEVINSTRKVFQFLLYYFAT